MANKLDYNKNKAPKDYKCSKCGKVGTKMWRQYNSFHIELLCVDDAMDNQGVFYVFDKDGYYNDPQFGKCDQIKWLIPAVPDEECKAYWGYTSVPQAGVDWWRRLPLR